MKAASSRVSGKKSATIDLDGHTCLTLLLALKGLGRAARAAGMCLSVNEAWKVWGILERPANFGRACFYWKRLCRYLSSLIFF
jgi:hypothetical protein